MQQLKTLFTGIFITLLFLATPSFAQETTVKDSVSQINVPLMGIFNQKTPSKYKIRSIKVVGNVFFDKNLRIYK